MMKSHKLKLNYKKMAFFTTKKHITNFQYPIFQTVRTMRF